MIEAYTGYPGNGKTMALTHRAYKAMKAGEMVFTNYPVKGAYRVTFDDLVKYSFPQGATVIIDESGRWFNSRKWKDLPSEVFDLFTLHRHMMLDLIVAVQNFNRIDVSLREVIELVWWSRNLPFLPFFIYEGYYDVEKVGLKGDADRKARIWKWTRSRKLYDTHIMSKEVNKDEIPLVRWGEDRSDEDQLESPEDSGDDGDSLSHSEPVETRPNRLSAVRRAWNRFRQHKTSPLKRAKAFTKPGPRRGSAE